MTTSRNARDVLCPYHYIHGWPQRLMNTAPHGNRLTSATSPSFIHKAIIDYIPRCWSGGGPVNYLYWTMRRARGALIQYVYAGCSCEIHLIMERSALIMSEAASTHAAALRPS
eukprot:scaffold314913_cov18-Prasinocladus_malaysianus.AAC.2